MMSQSYSSFTSCSYYRNALKWILFSWILLVTLEPSQGAPTDSTQKQRSKTLELIKNKLPKVFVKKSFAQSPSKKYPLSPERSPDFKHEDVIPSIPIPAPMNSGMVSPPQSPQDDVLTKSHRIPHNAHPSIYVPKKSSYAPRKPPGLESIRHSYGSPPLSPHGNVKSSGAVQPLSSPSSDRNQASHHPVMARIPTVKPVHHLPPYSPKGYPVSSRLVLENVDVVAHRQVHGESGDVQRKYYHFQVMKLLGEAQRGNVYLATPTTNNAEKVAVKEFLMHRPRSMLDGHAWPSHQEIMKQYKHELTMMAMLDHTNILRAYHEPLTNAVGSPGLYLLMEYCDNGDLFDYVEHGVSSVEAWKFLRQLVDGLAYMHSKSMAHLDIKVENLFLSKDNVLKIADLGSAQVFPPHQQSYVMNRFAGTVEYAPPEVVMLMKRIQYPSATFPHPHQHAFDPFKYDVYSAAVSYFHLRFGNVPKIIMYDIPIFQNTRSSTFLYEPEAVEKFTAFLMAYLEPEEAQLLVNMMHPDPKQRLSAEQVKQTHFYKYGPRQDVVNRFSQHDLSRDQFLERLRRLDQAQVRQ